MDNWEYLTELLSEFRDRIGRLEEQKVRVVSAPVTATDVPSSTFTVTMPAQEDGTTLAIGGIASPVAFLPAVGDTVKLQMVGSVPTYQPIRVAQNAVTELEIARGVKVHVWRQPNQPAGIDIGDVWYDTDDGNKQYIFGPTGTLIRHNLAQNPSFEADPVGTVTQVKGWANYTNGSPGTLTYSITNTGPGIADKAKAVQVVAASMPPAFGTAMGFRQTYAAAPSDVFSIKLVVTVAATDSNKLPEFMVEWLNSTNVVIGTGVLTSGSGTSTAQQTLSTTTAAAPAGTTSMRLTIQRRSTGTGGALTNADLMVDAVLVEKNVAINTPTGYFDGDTMANGDTLWDTPGSKPNSSSTYFQDAPPGSNQWYPNLLRSGGVMPNSLVASNIVAAGTINATLLEAIMVLTNTLIAGDPAGEHVTINANGLSAYSVDPATNTLYVSSSLGGPGVDFIGTTDVAGHTIAGLDGSGKITGRNLAIGSSATIAGNDLMAYINDRPRGLVQWGTLTGISGVGRTTEGGDCIMSFAAKANRMYRVTLSNIQINSTVSTDYGSVGLHYTNNGVDPTVTDPYLMFMIANHNNTVCGVELAQWNTDCVVKLLVTHGRNFGSGTITIAPAGGAYLIVEDIGPATGDAIVLGTTVTGAVQDYAAYRSPTWWHTFDGTPSLLNAGDALYVGNSPTYGQMRTNVGFGDVTAELTGATITWAGVYVNSPWWSNAAGGWPYIGRHAQLADSTTAALGTDFQQLWGTMARGEGRWLKFPTTWWSMLQAGTMTGLSFGPAPNTDQHYLGYFDGPTCQLGINYRK